MSLESVTHHTLKRRWWAVKTGPIPAGESIGRSVAQSTGKRTAWYGSRGLDGHRRMTFELPATLRTPRRKLVFAQGSFYSTVRDASVCLATTSSATWLNKTSSLLVKTIWRSGEHNLVPNMCQNNVYGPHTGIPGPGNPRDVAISLAK